VANNFLKMLFGQGTEPSYAGLRIPRQRMEDDARMIRLGNPQERFRQYHSGDTARPASDVLGLAPLSDEDREAIGSGRMEAPNSRFVETEEHKRETAQKKKDLVTGIGSDIARMFAQGQEQPQNRLQFDKLNMGQFIPLVDPRFRRAKGGKVKKGQPYLVGEEGAEVVIPEEDGTVLPNPSTVDEEARKFGGNRANFVPQEVTQTETEIPTTVTDTVTEDVVEPSVADMWRQKIQAVQGRDYSKKKNEDGTTAYGKDFDHKRNWKDALRGAGLGVLQSLANYQANPNDPNPLSSMLGRAIGGAGAGGVLGATVDNADNKMFDRMKLAQMMPQYEIAQKQEEDKTNRDWKKAQTSDILRRPQKEQETRDQQRIMQELRGRQAVERINRNADIKAGIAKPVINEGGYIELEYLNADASGKRRENELLKGADGQPIFVPGEQGLTWIDPLTKQPMQVKAKQTLMPGATIATGNAVRQTNADRDNAEKYWQTHKTNIDNQMKYMSDIKGLLAAAITADSGLTDDPGTRAEMEGKYNEIVALSNSPLPDTDDPSKAQEDRVKRVNQLTDDYNTLNNKLLDNLSKTAAGKAKADQIRAQIQSMPAPSKLTYTPYKPTMVTGGVTGKPVPASKDPMGLYR
jgi:predicted RNA-binding protein Jag